MEAETRVEHTWVDLIMCSTVLDEIVQPIADYMPRGSGLSDRDSLIGIIGIIEKRLGQSFVGLE